MVDAGVNAIPWVDGHGIEAKVVDAMVKAAANVRGTEWQLQRTL